MKINKISSFATTLNQVGKNSYITESQNYFILTEDKDKQLSSKAIAKIVQECLDEFVALRTRYDELNVPEQIALQKKLAEGLIHYSTQNFKNTKWKKVLSCIGFKSTSERRIKCASKKLLSHIKNFDVLDKHLKKAETSIPWKLRLPFQATIQDLRLFYHKTAENFGNVQELNGNEFFLSIDSIISDLASYDKKNEQTSFKQLISAFTYCRSISRLQYKWFGKCEMMQILSHNIFQTVRDLPTPNHPEKSYAILPGGYNGHAVLYYIEKHQDETYSFTIINTGDGLTRLVYPTQIDEHGVIHNAADQLNNGDEELALCTTYNQLTCEDLSQPFFQTLLCHNMGGISMTKIEEHVSEKLEKNNNRSLKYIHEVQKNGSCSMRCLLALINISMDDVVAHKDFTISMLKRELRRFDKNVLIRIACVFSPVISGMKEHTKATLRSLEN